ncbi:hypothetical protein [Edaphobacillus lindanitolerans]|uniref:Uncharacterized protein n=1 Tax=Edaphobacillus lindanitolerans TaxID=550447 RepID=A0A1U7PT30_9BACI|nr:hypothetical protein [Edaphobacillus lindanitolerans]SIT91176.1 hypothetical protein SAMN05428946_2615 [Edaphobacillus lindanitolerans]
MDDPRGFEDVPFGKSISYEHFLFYLEQGREIEFVYQAKEYFISRSLEGRAVWDGKTKLGECSGESHQDIVHIIRIDGVSLTDLINQNQIKISTVF